MAVSLGEAGKLEDARKVLQDALENLTHSPSAQDDYVKFLKKDLAVHFPLDDFAILFFSLTFSLTGLS